MSDHNSPWIDDRTIDFCVGPSHKERRLDKYLAGRFGSFSRAFFQKLIKEGRVTVNGQPVKAKYDLSGSDRIHIDMPEPQGPPVEPEYVPLDVIYEDDDLIVINKQPGMVVHPARGHRFLTLVAGVMFHCDGQLSEVDDDHRPGIVHRLDKDTSGVILFAKTGRVHGKVAIQFENRTTEKEYRAICYGSPRFDSGWVDEAIAKHPKDRTKMAVTEHGGRSAQTWYEVIERFEGFCYVKCFPKTGRTHQIRVHMLHLGCPVVGDKQYSDIHMTVPMLTGETRILGGDPIIARQALHAHRLVIDHPIKQERMEFVAQLPEDMVTLLEMLRAYRGKG